MLELMLLLAFEQRIKEEELIKGKKLTVRELLDIRRLVRKK